MIWWSGHLLQKCWLRVYRHFASHTDALRACHAFLAHERLLNGLVTSVCWQLVYVLKEPICCYLHVDTSVVCHVLMHCLGSLLQDVHFVGGRGQNMENMKCLLAFHIVALGQAVWLELFASRVCCFLWWIYIIFILIRFFFRDAVALLWESYSFV